MASNEIQLLIRVTEAQIKAAQENTQQLEKILNELSAQGKVLEKINHHFSNGFKKDIVDSITDTKSSIAAAEGTIITRLSSVVNSLRLQWAIIGCGVIPAIYYAIKDFSN